MMFYKKKADAGCLNGGIAKREREFRRIYRYLDRYEKLIRADAYREESGQRINSQVRAGRTIWICWLQGITQAPELVRACVESVRRNKPIDFDLVIITEDNLSEYVEFPSYISEKAANGTISRTHLSDILRAELLYLYGGLWIDATVYCGRRIPNYMCRGEVFAFQWSLFDPSVLKISSWWLYAEENQSIIRDVRNLLYEYWRNETQLRNYYLFHIMFSRAVDGSRRNREAFSNMIYACNSNPHILYGKLGCEFDVDEWRVLNEISPVHKLSYKKRFLQGDVCNYYTVLVQQRGSDGKEWSLHEENNWKSNAK